MQPQLAPPRPSDRFIPWYFVAFFALLTAVLVPMCIIAVRTNTGIVTDNAYEKGLAYNKTIAAAAEQNALKWQGDLSMTPSVGSKIVADFALQDASGKPLDSAEVKLWLVRPTQAGNDQTLTLQPQGNGHYGAKISLALRGLWEARVSATKDGHNYQMTKRVVLP